MIRKAYDVLQREPKDSSACCSACCSATLIPGLGLKPWCHDVILAFRGVKYFPKLKSTEWIVFPLLKHVCYRITLSQESKLIFTLDCSVVSFFSNWSPADRITERILHSFQFWISARSRWRVRNKKLIRVLAWKRNYVGSCWRGYDPIVRRRHILDVSDFELSIFFALGQHCPY